VEGGSEFRLEQAADGETTTIRVAGDVDLSSMPKFEDALTSALRSGGKRVEVDLGEVTYFGSEGVRTLVDALGVAAESGCRLEVVEASVIARRVLHVVGLDHVLRNDAESGSDGAGA
jgi:anti-sigma B factor antagonist